MSASGRGLREVEWSGYYNYCYYSYRNARRAHHASAEAPATQLGRDQEQRDSRSWHLILTQFETEGGETMWLWPDGRPFSTNLKAAHTISQVRFGQGIGCLGGSWGWGYFGANEGFESLKGSEPAFRLSQLRFSQNEQRPQDPKPASLPS